MNLAIWPTCSRANATAVRELLENPRVADAVIGFHAQQSIEKWLKAVLASRALEFERTHDLNRLAELVEAAGETLPIDRDDVSALTEFAVPFRYDDPFEVEPLERARTLEVVEAVAAWARRLIG